MSSDSNKVVLGYWRIRGLGQPIRLLLHYLGVDYEEKTYDFTPELTKDNWIAEREKLGLHFPNIPYLFDGSINVTESRAIIKHLCRTRKPELLGKTPDIETQADMISDFMYDVRDNGLISLVRVIYEYTEDMHKRYKELEARKLGYLSKFLGNKTWLTGNDITYADFVVYEGLDHMRIFDSKSLDNFSNLQAFMKRFEELPAIKAYMESDSFLKAPLYSAHASIKI